MAQVDKIAPDFPDYAGKIFQIPFFHWLLAGTIWVIGLGSPSQHTIDTVGVYFPTVLGALTVIPVYFLGKVMFGELAGIIGASLIVILPGEWFGRSSLGFTDHHVLEVLLTTTALMFLVMAIKSIGRKRIIYGLLTGLLMGLYWLTWEGAVLFVVILAVFLFASELRYFNKWIGMGIFILGGAIALIIYIEIIPSFFTGPTAWTIGELYPLDLWGAWRNFGLVTFLLPIALVLLAYQSVKRGEASLTLLLIWSLIILVLTIEYRRYAYYFAVNAALLTGWLVWYVWGRLYKKDLVKAIAVTAFLCGLIIFPNIQLATESRAYHTPPDAWYDTLTWVGENTPDNSLILAWWDYHHWIVRIADRKAYAASGAIPQITETSRFLLCVDEGGEVENPIDFDYLILDYPLTTYKFWAVDLWVEPTIEVYSPEYYQTLLMRLYNGEPVGQYALVYESEQKIEGISEVQVFYKRKIIDGQ